MQPEFGLLINAESLVHPLTGIGLYTRELLRFYVQVFEEERLFGFRGYAGMPAAGLLKEFDGWSDAEIHGSSRRLAFLHWLADKTTLPYRIHQGRVKGAFSRFSRRLAGPVVYHEPNFILKPWEGPCVATVHDLSVFHYPQYHPRSRVEFLQANLQDTLARADRVITDCSQVREELISDFRLEPEKAVTIHLGVAESFRPQSLSESAPVLEQYNLQNDSYVLCVATFEPRKNVISLIKAYMSLPETLCRSFPLVLAGGSGWGNSEADEALVKLQKSGRARNIGYVPRDHLPALYSGAAVFAFPSLYEGFGLPVLEAMACGTAVITSAGTSMAEFAGESVRLIDPLDVDALGHEIIDLLENEDQRRTLAASAAERSKAFTWKRCADRHLDVYQQAFELYSG